MLVPHPGRCEVYMFAAGTGTPRLPSTLILLSTIIFSFCPALHAQTVTVLHTFTGGLDGGQPGAGLSIDRAGNLYGTTSIGGLRRGCDGNGCGTVYKLARRGSGWILTSLYRFTGGGD